MTDPSLIPTDYLQANFVPRAVAHLEGDMKVPQAVSLFPNPGQIDGEALDHA